MATARTLFPLRARPDGSFALRLLMSLLATIYNVSKCKYEWRTRAREQSERDGRANKQDCFSRKLNAVRGAEERAAASIGPIYNNNS